LRRNAASAAIGPGIATGVASEFGLHRISSGLLYGVRAPDPITFVPVALLLLVVGPLAACIAARLAARIDPVVALRSE
jgi:putative ABC transport system permease protein